MSVGVNEHSLLSFEAIKGMLQVHVEVVEHLAGVSFHQGHLSQDSLCLQLKSAFVMLHRNQ